MADKQKQEPRKERQGQEKAPPRSKDSRQESAGRTVLNSSIFRDAKLTIYFKSPE